MTEKMHILITDGAGYIGSLLIKDLTFGSGISDITCSIHRSIAYDKKLLEK
jgi:nucleoside-diphosphate-sugar epimerase